MTEPGDSRIAIDLGRHRSFCALADAEGERLVPLSDKHDGLVLRWLTDRGSERITERLLRQAGEDQEGAVDTATALGQAIFPELAEGDTLASSPWIAIPPAFGPACRAALCDGLTAAGVPVTRRNLIDRPVASLAGWLASTQAAESTVRETATPAPQGTVLAIDNDGGQLSAAAADLDHQRLLFSVPLSVGPDDDEAEVESRLRILVEEAHRLRADDDLLLTGDWPTIAAAIHHVVLTGSACRHPDFLRLIERVLPDATIMGVRSSHGQAHTVVFGLLHLEVLSDFTACWPTGAISVNGAVVRDSGPVRGNDIPFSVSDDSTMAFTGPDGEELIVKVGSVHSIGLELPVELGPSPRLRLLSDGRILVLGPEGVRPLSVRVQWPLPSTDNPSLPLEVIGRRSIQLTDPRVALRRRATVGS